MTEANIGDREKALEKTSQYPLTFPQNLYDFIQGKEEEVHLRDYLNVIIRRRWILITFFIIVVTTVIIGTFLAKPQYKSTITIKIDKENPNILSFKDVVGLERAEEDYYQTQYKILKSRNLAKRVIRTLRLNAYQEFIPSQNVTEHADEADSDTLTKQVDPLKDERISSGVIDAFLKKVEVSPLQKSRLVNVSFISYDPELSAKVANAIGDAFIELNIETKFEATHQAREWLEKQLETMKVKVEQAEEKLNEYAAKNEIIFIEKTNEQGKGTESENIVTKKLSELSSKLTEATSDRISKEALYNEIRSDDPESSSVVMNNPLILDLKKTLATLETEYTEQLKIYKPDYPKMVRLKEQINQIKKKLDAESRKIVASIRNDYEIAVKRENQLKAALESQKNKALDLNQRIIQYQILKREADTNKELYNGLLQRLKETGISASLTTSNIQVLDRAEIPKEPYKPNKTLNIMLSIVVGLLGGIGIAFFTEYLDNTVKTPEDIEKKVYLPHLGFVPTYINKKEKLPVEYIAHNREDSIIAEAYRSIRTFLLLSTGGKPPRIMMVTSPIREDGKTTTAINTAISLCKSDAKVVLVDADMRKPRLHRIFSFNSKIGLSTFLSGNVEFSNELIQKSEIENLYVIPSGPIPPNPAELVSSYRLRELFEGLYSLYNFIIIDTPPIIGISDSLIISQSVDGVILVVRSGKTPKEAVQDARRLLNGVNAKILGVVLNSVNHTEMRYSHYYHYYKHYYHNEDQ